MIYADHAATTKMSAEAMAAMVKGWEVYGNPSSLHTIGQEAAVVLQKAREQIAVCLDADPKEIYFTSGGSEADNQALRSAAAIGKRNGHMHIISTAFEHHAILHTLEQLKAMDVSGKWGDRYGSMEIPTLREYFEHFKDLPVITNIELKTGIFPYPGIEERTLEMIREYELENKIIISSFNHFSCIRHIQW